MATGGHSLMAERVAIARAVHQFVDEPPLVFPDPLARPIIGAAGERWMRENMALFVTEGMRRARGIVAVRSRFAEDELAATLGRGPGQYVILGAGLDTFAYRRRDLTDRLTVYEVDEPATQRWKLERLAEASIALPPNLRLVTVDFNAGTLAGALAAAGFRRDLPAVFAWLGVVYYLPPESIAATLALIAGQAAATRVIFDFAVAEAAIPEQYRHLFRQFGAYNRTAGEQWRTWHLPEALKDDLRDLGLVDITHLDAGQVTRRYLDGRTDGLLTGPLVGLVSAGRRARVPATPE